LNNESGKKYRYITKLKGY